MFNDPRFPGLYFHWFMPIVVSELYGMYYSLRSEARIAEQSEFIVSSREKRAQCVNRAWVLASCKLAALILTCKYAYFNFYYYCCYFLFFPSLLPGIRTCYTTRESFYCSGSTGLFFYPLFFSLRTKHVTSQHNLWKDKRDNLQNKLESSSQKHK